MVTIWHGIETLWSVTLLWYWLRLEREARKL